MPQPIKKIIPIKDDKKIILKGFTDEDIKNLQKELFDAGINLHIKKSNENDKEFSKRSGKLLKKE